MSTDNNRRRGYLLAIELLEDASDQSDECVIEADCRDGRPQRNMFFEYLGELMKQDRDVIEGFCSVMTDLCASANTGCPNTSDYERMLGVRLEEVGTA